jgi:integrase
MVNIRQRSDTGKLFFDFRYQGNRCREYTDLNDTKTNRKKMAVVAKRMDKELQSGEFDYEKYFPNSNNLKSFSLNNGVVAGAVPSQMSQLAQRTPTFQVFAETWYSENEIAWRRTHQKTVADILRKHLMPAFGERVVGSITKAEIMAFRSTLGKVSGRKGNGLSPKRINAIMGVLRQILNEAADRFDFTTPFLNIKPLKVPKSHVEPFTLDEVQRIIETVRADYRAYYTVRFFTGLRTGEIDGLKWQYIDFDHRLILIRETVVNGQEDYTKNDGSQREIQMSQVVYDALREQAKVSKGISKYVFCNREGTHLDHNNVTKRVWYPLLRYLGLKERRPYQTRHTAATLWLAAGENPEWIARQMGHASTEMLFKVYSRYVPNLTRQDGSAFERLLKANFTHNPGEVTNHDN